MNKGKKLTTSLFLKNLNIVFLVFLFLLKYINCDCSGCSVENDAPPNCPSNCKHASLHNFFCEINPSNPSKYFYVDESKDCRAIAQCPEGKDKVVAHTKECVPYCGNHFEVGDFCFKFASFPSPYATGDLELIAPLKYKCKDYTYVQLIDGKEYHECLKDPASSDITGNDKKCPSFYDINEKKCVDSCENKKIKIQKNTSANPNFIYYECRSECEYKEEPANSVKDFEYDESQDIESSKNIYCLASCPSTAPFYYKISGTMSPKCLKKCESKHFYNSANQCLLNCEDTDLYLKEDSKDFFKCISKIGDADEAVCPDNHPYKYLKACLKSCKDTQLPILFNKVTYAYEDEQNNKNCVEDCSDFIDSDSFQCVSTCPPNKMFHYNKKCLKSCSEAEVSLKYYIKKENSESEDNEGGDDYKNYQCIDECPSGYYIYNDMCVKSCVDLSEKNILIILIKNAQLVI